ncbi:hypothetical protein GCM10017712_15610 [Curtobacterium citreum]
MKASFGRDHESPTTFGSFSGASANFHLPAVIRSEHSDGTVPPSWSTPGTGVMVDVGRGVLDGVREAVALGVLVADGVVDFVGVDEAVGVVTTSGPSVQALRTSAAPIPIVASSVVVRAVRMRSPGPGGSDVLVPRCCRRYRRC